MSSTNARYEDWADLPEDEYQASKEDLCETTLDALDKYVPEHPRVGRCTSRRPRRARSTTTRTTSAGASFGTKFEGLAVSRALPQQIRGLYHAGSVGIIMSGWLGAMNYGVIVANEVDNHPASPNGSRSTAGAEARGRRGYGGRVNRGGSRRVLTQMNSLDRIACRSCRSSTASLTCAVSV